MADSEETTKMHNLDPHERPPISIRNIYKKYQKMKVKELDRDRDIIDLSSDASASSNNKVHVVKEYAAGDLAVTFLAFAGEDENLEDLDLPASIPAYEHEDMPGKTVCVVTSIPLCVAIFSHSDHLEITTFLFPSSPDGR
jgi:hypothetical protein